MFLLLMQVHDTMLSSDVILTSFYHIFKHCEQMEQCVPDIQNSTQEKEKIENLAKTIEPGER